VSLASISSEDEERAIARLLERLPRQFPHVGASVYWPDDPACPLSPDEEVARLRRFIEETALDTGLVRPSDPVFLIWDDAATSSAGVTVEALLGGLDELERTSHLFIIPPTLGWCICLRTTGALGFALLDEGGA
jgi:hypothetical protein